MVSNDPCRAPEVRGDDVDAGIIPGELVLDDFQIVAVGIAKGIDAGEHSKRVVFKIPLDENDPRVGATLGSFYGLPKFVFHALSTLLVRFP